MTVVQDRVSGPEAATRSANVTGAIVGLLTWAWYFSGSTRAFGYDSSVTVGLFVTRGHAFDTFRVQYGDNNHPLISFAEHLVFDLTGSRSETLLRVLPITCAAATVALVCAWAARRYGLLGGTLAGLVVALNPAFVASGTEVRGYSLMVLAAVASTIVVIRALQGDASPRLRAGYLALVAIGTAAHLAMLVVVVAQLCLITQTRRSRHQNHDLVVAALIGTATGIVAYVGLLSAMAQNSRDRLFQPFFPVHLWVDMLGGSVFAAALVTPLIVISVRRNPGRLGLVAPASVVACAIAVGWVVAPAFFYTRFFMWLVPLAAIGVAAAVARVPILACAVLLAFVPQLVQDTRHLGTDANANRSGGALLRAADRSRLTACSAGTESEDLTAYVGTLTDRLFYPHAPKDLARFGCDVLLVLTPATEGGIVKIASKTFTNCAVLPARVSAQFYWTRPFPGMPAHGNACTREGGVARDGPSA